ncbi:helix-turn-helix transcriptional regulator [Streptomyces sp. NBC_00474]|uniref:helix-turn-helix domain-containing protein n=2 Tax=Streptomyces sp. NBC_00474 TaxID=2975754 RepID=UPI00224D4F81|nr:helix-turn-helix transcriptional regulator [Streptomyces sp. NBC_00474]MCX5055046.1 helix-turn-helix domain-containing protein [Streptomyces sp. NBC_00474]
MARPEKEIPATAPLEVAELARELRALRRAAKLTYQALSAKSHYSTATLSAAASGNTVPKWEVVESFVRACGVNDADLSFWKRLQKSAHARALAETAVRDTLVQSVDLAPAQQDDINEETDKHQGGIRGAFRKDPPKSTRPQLNDTIVRSQPDGLLTLVQQFVDAHMKLDAKFSDDAQRVSSLTVDHIHTALALCTTPSDVLAVMREMVRDKGLTIGDLERRSKEIYPISGATYAHVLSGNELPTTEWLHIFLRVCGVEQERTLIWHYTVTRIKIASLRHRTPDNPPPLTSTPKRSNSKEPDLAPISIFTSPRTLVFIANIVAVVAAVSIAISRF